MFTKYKELFDIVFRYLIWHFLEQNQAVKVGGVLLHFFSITQVKNVNQPFVAVTEALDEGFLDLNIFPFVHKVGTYHVP